FPTRQAGDIEKFREFFREVLKEISKNVIAKVATQQCNEACPARRRGVGRRLPPKTEDEPFKGLKPFKVLNRLSNPSISVYHEESDAVY
ncbi:MAG: hypothetical protein V3S22_04390, partial [Candidatus Neomarinimicrobiota bacterium]